MSMLRVEKQSVRVLGYLTDILPRAEIKYVFSKLLQKENLAVVSIAPFICLFILYGGDGTGHILYITRGGVLFLYLFLHTCQIIDVLLRFNFFSFFWWQLKLNCVVIRQWKPTRREVGGSGIHNLRNSLLQWWTTGEMNLFNAHLWFCTFPFDWWHLFIVLFSTAPSRLLFSDWVSQPLSVFLHRLCASRICRTHLSGHVWQAGVSHWLTHIAPIASSTVRVTAANLVLGTPLNQSPPPSHGHVPGTEACSTWLHICVCVCVYCTVLYFLLSHTVPYLGPAAFAFLL